MRLFAQEKKIVKGPMRISRNHLQRKIVKDCFSKLKLYHERWRERKKINVKFGQFLCAIFIQS